MCPVCIAAAVVLAGKITSTGGLAAIAIRKVGGRSAVDTHPAQTPSKEDRHD
jgi:hypothetical protein